MTLPGAMRLSLTGRYSEPGDRSCPLDLVLVNRVSSVVLPLSIGVCERPGNNATLVRE
jgi:hypothetical protein